MKKVRDQAVSYTCVFPIKRHMFFRLMLTRLNWSGLCLLRVKGISGLSQVQWQSGKRWPCTGRILTKRIFLDGWWGMGVFFLLGWEYGKEDCWICMIISYPEMRYSRYLGRDGKSITSETTLWMIAALYSEMKCQGQSSRLPFPYSWWSERKCDSRANGLQVRSNVVLQRRASGQTVGTLPRGSPPRQIEPLTAMPFAFPHQFTVP